jgi:hypothetical protein
MHLRLGVEFRHATRSQNKDPFTAPCGRANAVERAADALQTDQCAMVYAFSL